MPEAPKELHEEFPEHSEQIEELHSTSSHFKHLSDEFSDVVRQIDRMETGEGDVPFGVTKDLEQKRLALKDELFRLLMGV